MHDSHFARRRGLILGAAAGALSAATGMRSAFAQQQRSIVVTDPGGATQTGFDAAFYKPFEKQTGVKVNFGTRANMAMGQLKAMVLSNNVEWDATFMTDYLVDIAREQNLLEKIDYTNFNKTWLSQMLPGSCDDYSVGGFAFGTVMAFNKKKFSGTHAPRSPADFFDTKAFPGTRSLTGMGYGPLEFALLADGVPKDKLYPLDLPRAYAKLDKIRADVTVWSQTSAQQVQLLVNQEVDILQGYGNRIQAAIDQGAPYEIVWDGGGYQFQSWTIPRGAKNAALATQFIATTIDPKAQAMEAEMVANGPENAKAFDYIDAEKAKLMPTYPANIQKMFRVDAKWLAANFAQVNAAWSKWRVQ